jgi:hypothetical protein
LAGALDLADSGRAWPTTSAEKADSDVQPQGPKSDICAASFEAKKAAGDLGDNPSKAGYIRWCMSN